MSHVVTLRLSDSLGERLSRLAEATHRTKAFYVREALEAHLEDVEDYYLAAELSRRAAAGELPAARESWEDLQRGLGLDPAEPADPALLDDVE